MYTERIMCTVERRIDMSATADKKKNKVKFYKSIPVQILFFNILMLVVFNVVSYVVNDGISAMSDSAQGIIVGVTNLVHTEGTVKEDIAKMDGTI